MKIETIAIIACVVLAFISGYTVSDTQNLINDIKCSGEDDYQPQYVKDYIDKYGKGGEWFCAQKSLDNEDPDRKWIVDDRFVIRGVLKNQWDRYNCWNTYDTLPPNSSITKEHLEWLENYRISHNYDGVPSFNEIEVMP